MDTFYTQLKRALETAEGDIWTETVLEGEYRGEKRLLTSEPDEKKDSPRVYCERVSRTPRLIICGGGHVSKPIIRLGKMLGFAVTVIEDRPKFADNARAAGADMVVCQPFASALSQIRGDSDSWFIIVTRGHRYDTECLDAILQKKYAYVGMMGSRRRSAIVKEQLVEKGVSRERLEEVHTPIGLKIGAETPEEIAVSVMAEIIQVKNAKAVQVRTDRDKACDERTGHIRAGGYSEEMLACIFGEQADEKKASGQEEAPERKKVLATIISRRGSAPRGVGTKMLVLEDGSTVDTIGGGCVESEIIRKSLLMMRMETPDFQICTVDMTADEAEDEGMVCGGVVEVMLERISL